MEEWIAKNSNEYIQKAILFSSDRKILSDYKKNGFFADDKLKIQFLDKLVGNVNVLIK